MKTITPEYLEKRLSEANLPNQSRMEASKWLDFFLTYECKQGKILDPLIGRITREIEQWEMNRSLREGYPPPRLNKRSQIPNRRFKAAVRSLILNTIQVSQVIRSDVLLAVSKDANKYITTDRYSPHDMSYDPFIHAYDGLKALGYIEVVHQGYHDPVLGEGMCTKIRASQTLIDQYEEAKGEESITFRRHIATRDKDELIILKGENPKIADMIIRLPYEDNAFTKKARSNLKSINRVIGKNQIDLDCPDEIKTSLHKALIMKVITDSEKVTYLDKSMTKLYRIFSESSFERGGRFYSGWWQQVPKNYRKYITINDEPTIELDYASYHISIAYAQIGISPPPNPYNVHPKVSRKATKIAINGMLNAKGVIAPNEDFDSKEAGITWEAFITLIKEVHAPIVENGMWMTGYGLTLQYLDSLLAEKIMLHFAKKNVPCLPIHDSFIVNSDHEEELHTVMTDVFQERFGHRIDVNRVASY